MTLMDRFIANRGKPIEADGRLLYWTYPILVEGGDTVHVSFRHFIRNPVQGLAVDCHGCVVQIARMRARRFQLWSDSAPERVSLVVAEAQEGATLAFFNVWGDETHEPMLYRLNNAAIAAEEDENGSVTLGCSDGVGALDFSDLVVEITRTAGVGGSPQS